MFCPSCGIEERQANQFCRACGTDLRRVRIAAESPDTITASAVSARDEIGRAVAAKIRETQNAYELKKVAEDVLPEIEKFLESPEERRMRRIRLGTLLASIGLGASIALSIAAIFANEEGFMMIAGLGFITFFLGLGFIVNGLFLTVPRKALSDRSLDADRQRKLDGIVNPTNELHMPAEPRGLFTSVTENTTRHLTKEEEPVRRS